MTKRDQNNFHSLNGLTIYAMQKFIIFNLTDIERGIDGKGFLFKVKKDKANLRYELWLREKSEDGHPLDMAVVNKWNAIWGKFYLLIPINLGAMPARNDD